MLALGGAAASAQPKAPVVTPEAAAAARKAEAAQPASGALPAIAAMKMAALSGWDADERADDLYDRARNAIEEGHYDRAIADLDRLLAMNSNRTDAALYWKA